MSAVPRWESIRRLLVVRLDNTGDVLLTSPALRGLRAALPAEASITLLASRAGALAAPLLPEIDRVIVHRAAWQELGPRAVSAANEFELLRRLQHERFEAAVIFTSFAQSPFAAGYACLLAGIPIRAGHASRFEGQVLTHPVSPPPFETHEAERDLHLVTSLGAPTMGDRLQVRIPTEAAERAGGILTRAGIGNDERFTVVAPGASASARRYPVERFAEAAARIASRSGMHVIVAGSEHECELASGLAEQARHPLVTSIAGATDVPTLAAVIERSTGVIANNSLAMHLADAVETPAVVTYAGTDLPVHWRPRRTSSRLLGRATDCAPCHHIDCPYSLECLDLPGVDVAEAALEAFTAEVSAP